MKARNKDAMRRLADANPHPTTSSAPEEALQLARQIVSRESSRGETALRPIMRRHTTVVAVAVLAAVLIPAGILAATHGVFGLSNPGEPVTSDEIANQDLNSFQASGAIKTGVYRLAVRGAHVFYAARSETGGLCLAVGNSSSPQPTTLSATGCLHASPTAFPSAANPVQDFSVIGYDAATGTFTIRYLGGFAADGVASVAVLGANGKAIATTSVTGNVYSSDEVPDVQAVAIAAYDGSGKEVMHRNLDPARATG
jgi:hypothetical protein